MSMSAEPASFSYIDSEARFSGWEIPGRGESHPACGTYRPAGVCENGHADYVEHSCGRRSCPDCRALWTQQASVRATVRVQGRRLCEPPDYHRQTAHCFYRPPDGTVGRTWEAVMEMKAEACEYIEEKGYRGYMAVIHPFVMTEFAKTLHERAETELKRWMWLIKEADIRWHDAVKWAPHVHFIGLTSPDMDPREEGDGTYYEFKRSFDPLEGYQDLDSHSEVHGTIRYLLSHTGYPDGYEGQAYTWHGEMANNVFVDDATEEWQTEKPGVMKSGELETEIRRAIDDEKDTEMHHEECQKEGCGARVVPLQELETYIEEVVPPPEVELMMKLVLSWTDHGDMIRPPAGLRSPRSVEEFGEAAEWLVTAYDAGLYA